MTTRLVPLASGHSLLWQAVCLTLFGSLAAGQDADLERALAAEARQVRLVKALAPSVAAVSKPGKPGGGSGVIIDPRGYVLTNFHVSGTSRRLIVGLNDGKAYKAHLLGIDPGGDIALLKLDDPRRKTWPYVPLGDSDALTIGEPVLAMGNPFGLAEDFSPTVTQGIVSGVHRYRAASGSSDLVYGDCIQLDASINPGNSGGPLFSSRGTLLGINGLGGFRPDRGRVNVGVGFAASINQIKNFLLDLRACKHVYHGTMNATVRDQELPNGRSVAIIDAITRSSNAYKAGLRLSDVVRLFDGESVSSQNELLMRISRLPSGRRVELQVDRANEDGRGATRLKLVFRLEPLWSGPQQGKWQPDTRLLSDETMAILKAHRATKPPQEYALTERVTNAKGRVFQRLTHVKGRKIRVESQGFIDVYDGRGWRRRSSGGVAGRLPSARRDALGGRIEAQAGLHTPRGGSAILSSIKFTGGERLDGRTVVRLETRDAAGRRRKLYLDPKTHFLIGQAYPDPTHATRWIEETIVRKRGQATIRRVDDATGALIETSSAVFKYGPQDDALFTSGGR